MDLTLGQIKQHLKRQGMKYICVYPLRVEDIKEAFLFAKFNTKSEEQTFKEFSEFFDEAEPGLYTIVAKPAESSPGTAAFRYYLNHTRGEMPHPNPNAGTVTMNGPDRETIKSEIRAELQAELKAQELQKENEELREQIRDQYTGAGRFALAMEKLCLGLMGSLNGNPAPTVMNGLEGSEAPQFSNDPENLGELEKAVAIMREVLGDQMLIKMGLRLKKGITPFEIQILENFVNH